MVVIDYTLSRNLTGSGNLSARILVCCVAKLPIQVKPNQPAERVREAILASGTYRAGRLDPLSMYGYQSLCFLFHQTALWCLLVAMGI
jgi:hypothetical protein